MTSSLLLSFNFTLLLFISNLTSFGAALPENHSAQIIADDPVRVKRPWIFIKAGGSELPIQLEISGQNQIVAHHLGAFYGIADGEKSIFFNLNKGVVVNASAVFGTRVIKTPRTALAVNSALHFKNGATYHFRTVSSTTSRSWENLNENNLDGTTEVTPGLHHVDGYASYEGSGTFTFPLGNGTSQYRPLTSVGNDGQVITAAWLSGDPSNANDPTDANASHNRNMMLKGIKKIYASGQWDWHIRPSGTALAGTTAPGNVSPAAPVKIMVGIPEDIASLTGTNTADLTLVGWNGTVWEPLQNPETGLGTISAYVTKPVSAISLGVIDRGALPVTLVQFSAHAEGNTAVLNWTTSIESNSGHFDIERSQSGKDWLKIGKVSAAGESTQLLDYTFSDPNALAGNNLYRLKMVDEDSSFAYSRIQSVFIGRANSLTVFPNPASNILSIDAGYEWEKIVNVTMYDIYGRAVHSSQQNAIDVKKFQPGIYTLQITGPKNDIISKNVIIER